MSKIEWLGFFEFFLTDHLGNTRIVHNSTGTLLQQTDYYAFGMDIARSQSVPNKYKYNGKEKQDELGQYDYGARFYDPVVGRWHVVDPLANSFPHMSPYSAFNNNPIFYIDPDGRMAVPPSTHLDDKGNVVAVFEDGDYGVYQHGKNADGGSVTEYQLSKRAEKHGTSSGRTKVGETQYLDEFVSPEDGTTMTQYNVQVGKSFDPIISEMSKKADGMGLYQIAQESRPGGDFDIKGPYENVGGLLNGKYVTSRSAGNYLAGYNANNGVINYTTFQKLAGKLHQQGFSTKEAIKTVLYGDHIGTALTYGENMYQYRMSVQGWSDKGKTGAKIDMNQFKRTPTNGLKW